MFCHAVGPLHWNRHAGDNVWLVLYPEWMWRLLVVLHLGSIAILYACFLQSDYLEFWGIKQAWRGLALLRGKSVPDTGIRLFGTHRLLVSGLVAANSGESLTPR